MDRQTYLQCLAQELSRWVPEQERKNMLRYYEEYFDEAGRYQEQTVIAGLGDPAKLARALAEEAGFIPRKRKRAGLAALVIGMVIVIPVIMVALIVTPFLGFRITRHISTINYEMDDDGSWWAETEQGSMSSIASLDQGADITVELPFGNVMVCTGPVELIHVDQNNSPDYKVIWHVEDNQLVVESEGGGRGPFEEVSAETVITIPENWELGEVRIDTKLGDINLQGVSAHDLYLNTGLGDILMMGTTAGFLDAETGLGDMTVTDGLPLDSELSTGSGDIWINTNCTSWECGYDLETGLRQIYVDGQNCGSESSYNVEDRYYISGETGYGDIHLDFLGG